MTLSRTKRLAAAQFTTGCALCLATATTLAGNGLNDPGFGPRSQGMGGADLAVANDMGAMNINPAGLSQIKAKAFDVYLEPYYFDGRHADTLGNDSLVAHPIGGAVGGGYAQRLADSSVVVGIGFFGQGGAGFEQRDLATPFGTRDVASSTFGAYRLAPSIAWRATDQLSVGVALGINYSQGRQKFLPNTSFMDSNGNAPSFNGFRADSLDGWSLNGKVGFQYQLDPQWVIAAAYTSKTPVKLRNGKLTVNYEADGLGQVVYNRATQTGLAIPREAGIAAAYRPNGLWLVTAEVNWLDWSQALKSGTLTASSPENAQVPQSLSFTGPLEWRDQYVIAVGAEHRWSELTTIRFGFNYGRNPIPGNTQTPTLPLILEKGVAAGFTRRIAEQWELSASALYQLPIEVEYTNPTSPFGPNSRESGSLLILNFMVSRRW